MFLPTVTIAGDNRSISAYIPELIRNHENNTARADNLFFLHINHLRATRLSI